jgi:hypothetical protein
VANVQLNGQSSIYLTENTTTPVSATATVDDPNGCNTVFNVTAKMYRSGVSGAQSCSANANNCYSVSCTENTGSCTGAGDTDATYTCSINMQYHADPTDANTPWDAEYWRAYVSAQDAGYLTGNAYSPADVPDVMSLLALMVSPGTISYGNMNPGTTPNDVNVLSSAINTGNVSTDLKLYGTNMTSGVNSISVGEQRYNTSVASYSSSTQLLLDPGVELEMNLPKTTVSATPQYSTYYWGIRVPSPQQAGDYSGVSSFIGVVNELPWP